MGQVLHGCATTTEAVRRAIQNSQESLRALAKRYEINQKTVAKWKKREAVADLPTGPKEAKSSVLSLEDEAIIVAFRKHTLLPLDDCLYALQATIPHLTRSSLHRCLQRHGISRLPDVEGDKPPRLEESANIHTAAAFLKALIEAVPYKIHTLLTDNGIQFCDLPSRRNGPTARLRMHMFDRVCRDNSIEHRLTKPNHPWTNGQVEQMNRTIKEATVKRYHYDRSEQLDAHLTDFINAYNYARRLKTLKGLTPYEYICKIWTEDPNRFKLNPLHQMPGLNS
jgi:hypothetical protein